jgi:hypothetical protein
MPEPNTITLSNGDRKCLVCRTALYPIGLDGVCFACRRKEQIQKAVADEKVKTKRKSRHA